MSYLVDYSKWRSIVEAEGPSLSKVYYKAAFTGATRSNAPNKDALAEFKSANPGIAFADEATLDETKAIAKVKSADGKFQYKVIPKTINAKDYLKIGPLTLNGADGRSTTIDTTKQDLYSGWEAAGNGIFALGRALALSKKIDNEDLLIIGLNNTNPNSFIADAKTGLEDSLQRWKQIVQYTFILPKAVIPSASNQTINTQTAIKLSNQTDALDQAKTYFNRVSIPNVPTEDKADLAKDGKVDVSTFIDKIKGKSAKSYDANLAALVKEFTDTYVETHINTYADRFKKFINMKAASAGIDLKPFAGLIEYVDRWKENQLAMKANYLAAAEKEIQDQFQGFVQGKTSTSPQTSVSGKVITGKEGEL